MRYIATLVIAALINLGLFLLISFMLVGQNGTQQLENLAAVDFVRLRREPEPPKPKERRLPEKPKPPPPEAPLPLPVHRPQAPSPRMSDKLRIVPNIEIPLALNSTGPYLGSYRQPSAGPRIALAMEGSLVPLVRIPPQYPSRAARRGIEGSVTVAFIITKKGSVRHPRVIDAHPPGIFNEAALRAIRRWRFKAKKVDGQWVAQRATQIIQFQLDQ